MWVSKTELRTEIAHSSDSLDFGCNIRRVVQFRLLKVAIAQDSIAELKFSGWFMLFHMVSDMNDTSICRRYICQFSSF